MMAGAGWSPVMRSRLNLKRRCDPITDLVDDGGRAIILEESLRACLKTCSLAPFCRVPLALS